MVDRGLGQVEVGASRLEEPLDEARGIRGRRVPGVVHDDAAQSRPFCRLPQVLAPAQSRVEGLLPVVLPDGLAGDV